MDETLKQALSQFAMDALTATKTAATWTADQAPLAVQEWLRWQAVEGALALLGILLAFALLPWLLRRTAAALGVKDWFDLMPLPLLLWAGPVLVATLWGPEVREGLMAVIAPRVLVIELVQAWLR